MNNLIDCNHSMRMQGEKNRKKIQGEDPDIKCRKQEKQKSDL